jgi:D-alanine transaminase
MAGVAYVNGSYLPLSEAAVSIEDRGFQFADAVYEAWAVLGGQLADADGHFTRLERSLDELRIDHPMSRAALKLVIRETLRRNRITNGFCYLQITRGQAHRDHAFPKPSVRPSVIVTAKPLDYAAEARKAEKGVAVFTQPDIRWGRCDIKTVGLLPNVLAKQAAKEQGGYEAWLVDEQGMVTEGASTNAWIVTKDGVLVTRDTSANILRGITRMNLIELAGELQMPVEQRAFSVLEAQEAKEAFLTAASAFVTPIVAIDGKQVGDGKPGPVAARLRAHYIDKARRGV